MPPIVSPTKRCSKCGQEKPATPEHFHRHAKSPDGLYPSCKVCKNGYARTPAGKESRKRKDRRREKNPITRLRRQAKGAVHDAVRHGRLPPAAEKRCERCGRQAEVYHHDSYLPDDRLKVMPLCRRCHDLEHARDRKSGVKHVQRRMF